MRFSPCVSIPLLLEKPNFEWQLISPFARRFVQLLIAVINQEDKLDQILSGMVELGITGATIISSEGMGRVLSHDVPIFAGLESLALGSRPRNQTIFSVINEDEKVEGVFRLLREICGDLENPATGIAFTIPVNRVMGLAPELGT
jgi:nitrogen regulatory protein P-II 1